MRTFLRENGLSLCLAVLFAVSFYGQIVFGRQQYNQTQVEHGRTPVSYGVYLRSGEFLEATFENWESEFLQMALFVWLTSFLYQKGSAESKDPYKEEAVDEDPRPHRNEPGVPFPVRRGGMMLRLYELVDRPDFAISHFVRNTSLGQHEGKLSRSDDARCAVSYHDGSSRQCKILV
ncbi:MAG TPA: DUF6766 family protein [Bryobacteraceae bacterium]|nr:DUF6766 family protein [Bryobacteraceae bacterium]